jgi:Protein of unknown function (DUF1549)/Protein of unknown function (DUF1553)
MKRILIGLVAFGSVMTAAPLRADDKGDAPAPERRTGAAVAPAAAVTWKPSADPADLAKRIDHHIGVRLKEVGANPVPKADDAEFLRRVYLDLAGRIPLTSEVHAFLGDKSPDKRRKLVEHLLNSPGYVSHMTDVWRNLLLPEASTNFEVAYVQMGFDSWLRKKAKENTPWDQLARELVTAPIGNNRNNQYVDFYSGRENPTAYFQAKEGKPENVAAATARIFLGIHIECAQCHNHPFAKWSREQFWNTAAFFAGVERTQPNFYSPLREVADRREIAIPNLEKVVQAAFLDAKEPRWKFQTSSRVTFAEWMTADDNPFFARTAVNRIWHQMFGVGIVDPPDDFNEENKASHPELLDDLAKAFIAAKYDVKFLMRAIAASEAYQRTSSQTDSTQSDPRLFSRMTVKAMTGEQLFDSLATAISYRDPFPRNQPAIFYGGNSPRAEFLSKFAASNKPTEAQTSILQALTLMNSKFVADATSFDKADTPALGAIVDSPFLSTPRKIETMYLAALGRKPHAEELAKLVKHVETGDAAKQKQRLGDVFWTLINTVEFRVNH